MLEHIVGPGRPVRARAVPPRRSRVRVRGAGGGRPVHGRGARPAQPGRRQPGQPPRPGRQRHHARPASRRPTGTTWTRAGGRSRSHPSSAAAGSRGWSTIVLQEMLTSANMAFSLCPLLTQGAIDMLAHHGSPEQQATYLEKMVTGEWTGTMNLTEPEAGSDVGALRTRAVPAGDGTLADHRAEDLHHLRRARPDRQHRPPGPGPGARRAARDQRDLLLHRAQVPGQRRTARSASRNDVRCVSIEHKMGIHASPTCVMSLRRRGRRGRLPDRRGQRGHAVHVHDDEQRPALGRPRGPGHRRAGLPGRLRLRPGAQAGSGHRRAGGHAARPSSSTPTCAGCC